MNSVRTPADRPLERRRTRVALGSALLVVLSSCTSGQDHRDDVSYEDVEIETITAPPSSARGAREYLQSSEGQADGEALKIAWINDDADWDVSMRAAVTLVNAELTGVNGRPIELLACDGDEKLPSCASRLASEEPALALLGSPSGEHGLLRDALGSVPAIGVEPEDPRSWRDPLTHYFTLGTIGVLRAATVWASTQAYDSMLVLAPYPEVLDGTFTTSGEVRSATLVLEGGRSRDAEKVIAAALDDLNSDPSAKTLVVNLLDQDGCVSLARTVDPTVADLAWGSIDVITTGTCAGKQVHDELGDWPPEWYHIGGGPDLQIYELDQQVRVYRDRITRYGDETADWTGDNSLPFGALLTAVRMITQSIPATGTPESSILNDAIRNYRGPAFMGMPEHHCGVDSTRPALCAHQARVFLYTGQRDWRNIVGEPFDILP
jgi:branched-chain amino acid transport system substrate-binding protein